MEAVWLRQVCDKMRAQEKHNETRMHCQWNEWEIRLEPYRKTLHAITWGLACIVSTTVITEVYRLMILIKWYNEWLVRDSWVWRGMANHPARKGLSALTFALRIDWAGEWDLGTQEEGNAHRHSECTPYGEENLPQNRMQLALLCLRKKRKGWSAQNLVGSTSHSTYSMCMSEAAAASGLPHSPPNVGQKQLYPDWHWGKVSSVPLKGISYSRSLKHRGHVIGLFQLKSWKENFNFSAPHTGWLGPSYERLKSEWFFHLKDQSLPLGFILHHI